MDKEVLKKGKISRLFSDEGGGDTGEANLLEYKDKKYVLRIASNLKKSKRYVEIYKGLKKYNVLPKLLFHSGKNNVFEYVEGRDLIFGDISLKTAFNVGRISGSISNLKFANSEKYDLNGKFLYRLKFILDKRVISKKVYYNIITIYNTLKKSIKLELAMDINDPTPDNFRLRKGKIYFIDIHAIELCPKGLGISKAFLRWFKTDGQRDAFLKGYSSVSDAKYITREYLQFIYLFHLVSSIYSRIKDKRDPSERIEMLNKLLEGKLK